MDVGRQDHARQSDGIEELIVRAGRCAVHAGAGLRQEVLDDDLLHVPVTPVRSGNRLERRDAIEAVLADADEDPGRERDRELARGFEGGEPPFGGLVRRAAVAVEIGPQRLDHHPL